MICIQCELAIQSNAHLTLNENIRYLHFWIDKHGKEISRLHVSGIVLSYILIFFM